MVKQIIDRLLSAIRADGVTGAAKRAVTVLRHSSERSAIDSFDAEFKTDTFSTVRLWRLKIPSNNAGFGVKYQTLTPSHFLNAIRLVPEPFADVTFVDLGSGKGRTLILAAREGFKRVLGVEFSPQLAAIARSNLQQVGVSAEILQMDASEFIPPHGTIVVYLYNPFGDPVVAAVANNLRRWATHSGNRAFLVYVNPAFRNRFDTVPEFEPLVDRDGLCIWRLQKAC